MSEEVDIFIVGQGLAGSLLAWELLHLGAKIRILDSRLEHAAYPVAAGILNPITGKRIVKSWKADQLIPEARAAYRTLGKAFGKTFFEEKPILRLFKDAEEEKLWEEKKQDPEYQRWLGERFPPGHFGKHIQDAQGSFSILGGGWLAVKELVETLHDYLEKRGCLLREALHYGDISLKENPDRIHWKDFQAKRIVFCEGFRGAENPWFRWLDYRLSKGEVLDVETTNQFPDYILNKGKWILPTGLGTARVGATYSWDSMESGPSLTGMAELVREIQEINPGNFPVHAHRSGIRPGTNDSKPYVGWHPLEPRLAILNGFGSKGSLYGPATARELAAHLVHGKPISPEWNIERRLKFLKEPLSLP